jgi:hypothetical protein
VISDEWRVSSAESRCSTRHINMLSQWGKPLACH